VPEVTLTIGVVGAPLRVDPDVTATYEVRPIEPGDTEALRRMFYRLSADTVYRRFFRPIHEPSASVLRYLCAVDHDRRDALVAVDPAGEVIAVARYDRLGDSDEAEVAVVVEDAWQGHGIGSRLVRKLGALAESRGLQVFTATMLGDNRAAAKLLHKVDDHPDVHLDHGELVSRSTLHV
jgi:RimJ/RimL family protein N-acetyltransferase